MTPQPPKPICQENPYHLQHNREARPTENVNNQDKGHFNKSLDLIEGSTRFAKAIF